MTFFSKNEAIFLAILMIFFICITQILFYYVVVDHANCRCETVCSEKICDFNTTKNIMQKDKIVYKEPETMPVLTRFDFVNGSKIFNKTENGN